MRAIDDNGEDRMEFRMLDGYIVSRAGLILLLLTVVSGAAAAQQGSIDAAMLVEAVKNADVAAARGLLTQNVDDVNAPLPDRSTLLHWAAHTGDSSMVELLLGAGARVDAVNEYGVTPLMVACENGYGSVVEELLAAGAVPNTTLPTGKTVLMECARAGSVEGVEVLLASGADPNMREPRRGQTALMWAVSRMHAGAARALIEGGADTDARSKGGFTPMLFAARVGDVDSAKVLLSAGVDANEGAEPGGMTPLSMAAASGHEALSVFLVENGADPNAWDGGAVPLHYAAMEGISYLHFRPAMKDLVKTLLANGADPNVQLVRSPVDGFGANLAGATPLVIAAGVADLDTMRDLLAAGADPELSTRSKVTPLMAAAGMLRREAFPIGKEDVAIEALELLMELGGDVNSADVDGRTALHVATHLAADRVVRFLGDHGADVDARDKYQQTPLSAAMGIRLPWVPKNEELGEEGFVKTTTAELLLGFGATPVDTAGYFTPVDLDSDASRFNPTQATIPGLQ